MMETHTFSLSSISRLVFTAMNKKMGELIVFEEWGEKIDLQIPEEELIQELEEIAAPLAFSFEKRITSYLNKQLVIEEDDDRSPTLAEFKKMKIVEIKEYVEKNGIKLPKAGSGKNRNLIKRDYIDSLATYLENNGPFRFYGHRKGRPGWMFSNFSSHPIEYVDLEWPTVEHAFQALKFCPHDMEWFNAINSAGTPQRAKQMGNTRKRKLRKDWESVKDKIMEDLLYLKTESHEEVYDALLETDDREIIEASPIDYYWGEGKDHTGKNMLGKIWMRVRSRLREE